ncbi:hypothetical protein B0H14DRAFT_2305161, partial [Mycena olivaceomarginata]
TPDDTAPQDKSEWPKWMRDGSALLDACPAAGSEEWADAVRTWAQLEEAYGYQTTVSESHCACLRPAEVAQWIKYGRSTTRETQVENHDKLVEKWWGWWTSLAPEWRKKDETGRPAISEVVGDWGVLAHPGGNGIMTVLLPLVWWRRGEKSEGPSEDWAAAVRDVLWVLKGL